MLHHSVVSDSETPWTVVHQAPPSTWILQKNTRVGCHAFLQGIFPSQGSNPGLLHCRQILYCLNHQGSPRKLEWVVSPFSRGSSRPGIEPGSPALQADSLPAEPLIKGSPFINPVNFNGHLPGAFFD